MIIKLAIIDILNVLMIITFIEKFLVNFLKNLIINLTEISTHPNI